ncbi:phosphotransferase [Stutzerimonas tarimensis]|uniref:Phosphotransferase n=1 Tax=Stutzerimonas tarimensis TaxID=1507735 RepID=A0ABV7T5H0_9GAMM
MRTVSEDELQQWLADGKMLERDGRGPKVVSLADGLFLKIFHTRRHPLLARLEPAALRFTRNTEALRERGIAAPQVTETFWLDHKTGLSGCLYTPLAGESIDRIFRQDAEQAQRLIPDLAKFIRRLHQSGIYFRSLHLGNVLLLPDGQFGLIDVLDLKARRGPLNRWLVRRNFSHLRRYLERTRFQGFPLERLEHCYWTE